MENSERKNEMPKGEPLEPREQNAPYNPHCALSDELKLISKLEGRAEGRAEERIENAKALKQNGVDEAIIAKSLGLSMEQVHAL